MTVCGWEKEYKGAVVSRVQRYDLHTWIIKLCFFMAQQSILGLERLVFEVSRSYTIRQTHTPGRTPLDEWSARYLHNTQQTQETNIHALGGIRTRNPSKWAAADLRLTPCGHWDRHMKHYKHLVHLVGFTIGIYYGARPYGRQINIKLSSQLRLLTVSFHFSPSIDGLLSSPFSANSSCTFLWSSSFPSLQKPSAVGHISRVLFLWFSRNT